MSARRACAHRLEPAAWAAPLLPTLVILLALLAASPARAQFAGRVSLMSDDRFRGRSLSQGRPALSLDLSYDAAGGYAGVTATGVDTAHSGVEWLGGQVYAGYVRTLAPGRALDLGLTHSSYSEYYGRGGGAAYTEAYFGLIAEHVSSHLYYSPDYFGHGAATLYGEVDGVISPAPRWRATAHLGLLERVGGRPGAIRGGEYDWRLGLGTTVRGFEAQLAWTGLGPRSDYYGGREEGREALVFVLARNF